jgi:hypothetical protein
MHESLQYFAIVKRVFFTVVCMAFFLPATAFADSGNTDSLSQVAKRRANKAALMSAILPGSGQVMNKKYWKVPIIYGGGFAIAYFVKTNNDEYHNFQDALIYRSDNDPATVDDYPFFTADDLKTRRDYYRRNRDLSYIFAGLLYTLNIIDAYVDSQLMDFDVSDNLSLKLNPVIETGMAYQPVPSLNLILNFK